MQLDIFADSMETVLLNDVVKALEKLSFHEAENAVAKLAAEYPDNSALSSASAILAIRNFPERVARHEQLLSLFAAIEESIEPAAIRIFGSNTKRWMNRQVWQRLAAISFGLPYCESQPTAHAVAALIRAQEWYAAIEAIVQITGWRRMPMPLQWMATATVRNNDLDAAWPFLLELAWMAPAAFGMVVRDLHDPVLLRLMKDFEASLDDNADDQLDWFPALAVTAEPALLARVRGAAPAKVTDATRAFECICALLLLEKQGRQAEIATERARLRSLNDQLYSRYMRTR